MGPSCNQSLLDGRNAGHHTDAKSTLISHLSITSGLILLNLIVFAAMLVAGSSALKPTPARILEWGGTYAPLTLNGQWWRLFTAMFVHSGIVHLCVNMWALWIVGDLAERIFGAWNFLLVYLLTGVAGNILSSTRSMIAISAGASGAIFGITGALLATFCLRKFPHQSKRVIWSLLISLLAFSGYNLIDGLLKGGVDNNAHIGGIVSGLVIGIFLSGGQRDKVECRYPRQYVFSVVFLLLLVSFSVVRRMQGDVVHIELGRRALNAGNLDLAIRELKEAKKKNSSSYVVLGAAYLRKREYAQAEACFKTAVQLAPSNAAALRSLGVFYLDRRQLEAARLALLRVTQLTPQDAMAWMTLGGTLQQMGKHEDAVASFKKAMALDPKLGGVAFALGISEMNLRNYDEAISAFQQAVMLNPNDFRSRIWLANSYEAKGLRREADAAFLNAYLLRHRIAQPRLQEGTQEPFRQKRWPR